MKNNRSDKRRNKWRHIGTNKQRNRQRNKQEGGAAVYVLAVYALVMILATFLCVTHLKTMAQVKNEFDTGLLLALLGSATINMDEYGRFGSRVIHESSTSAEGNIDAEEKAALPDSYLDNALAHLQKSLQTNLGMKQDGMVEETIVLGPIVLEEFKVFNVYEKDGEKQIYEFTWQGGAWSVMVHAVNENVYVAGAGERGLNVVSVTDTTLYAKIGFDIRIFPYFSKELKIEDAGNVRVYMSRSVSVPAN